MLPIFTPNLLLSHAIQSQAILTDSLSLQKLADTVGWAARHYAVDTNVYPLHAAYDAAQCIAANLR